MTEQEEWCSQEWRNTTDKPMIMLDYLRTVNHSKPVSDRKLRFFGLNLYMMYEMLQNPPRMWVNYFADCKWVDNVGIIPRYNQWNLHLMSPMDFAARSISAYTQYRDELRDSPNCITTKNTCDLMREMFGNPFQPATLPMGIKCWLCEGHGNLLGSAGDKTNPQCDQCNGTGHRPSPVLTPLVVQLAEAAYTVRTGTGTLDNDALAVLSDALEEAGLEEMTNPILAHLREPGPHYRGCWATDILLGKE